MEVISNDNVSLRNELAVANDRIAKQDALLAQLRAGLANTTDENIFLNKVNAEAKESINVLLDVEQKNVQLNEAL